MCIPIDYSAIELKYQPKLKVTAYSKKTAWENYVLWKREWNKILRQGNTPKTKQAEDNLMRRILISKNLPFLAGQLIFSFGEIPVERELGTKYLSIAAMWTGAVICRQAKDVRKHPDAYRNIMSALIHKEQYVSPEDARCCNLIFGHQWDQIPYSAQSGTLSRWLMKP
jgi:hypothetical protein